MAKDPAEKPAKAGAKPSDGPTLTREQRIAAIALERRAASLYQLSPEEAREVATNQVDADDAAAAAAE